MKDNKAQKDRILLKQGIGQKFEGSCPGEEGQGGLGYNQVSWLK